MNNVISIYEICLEWELDNGEVIVELVLVLVYMDEECVVIVV